MIARLASPATRSRAVSLVPSRSMLMFEGGHSLLQICTYRSRESWICALLDVLAAILSFKQRRPRGAIGCQAISPIFVMRGRLCMTGFTGFFFGNLRLELSVARCCTAKVSSGGCLAQWQVMKLGVGTGHVGFFQGMLSQPWKGLETRGRPRCELKLKS